MLLRTLIGPAALRPPFPVRWLPIKKEVWDGPYKPPFDLARNMKERMRDSYQTKQQIKRKLGLQTGARRMPRAPAARRRCSPRPNLTFRARAAQAAKPGLCRSASVRCRPSLSWARCRAAERAVS